MLFLVSYACNAVRWFDLQPEFGQDLDLTEVVAIMLARMTEQATRRGLLNGYQTEDGYCKRRVVGYCSTNNFAGDWGFPHR